MFQGCLPLNFWGDSVSTTAHLINRTPSPVLDNKSPYELLYGTPPSYLHLKIFGCLAYAATILHTRTKFTPRSSPCIFLGYPLGYKLYNLTTRKFLIFRDVISHEDSFPFKYYNSVTTHRENFPTITPYTKTTFEPPSQVITALVLPIAPPNPPALSDSDLIGPIIPPQPTATTQPAPQITLRRSTRPHNTSAYLQDYSLNYAKLSPTYLAYLTQVSAIPEPLYYHQAAKSVEWCKAMEEEINALEANNT